MRREHYEVWVVKGDRESHAGRDFSSPVGALAFVESRFSPPLPGKVEIRRVTTITKVETLVFWDSEKGEWP